MRNLWQSAAYRRWRSALPAVLALFAALGAGGCQDKAVPVFQGYVEGEFVMLAAPLSGRLEKLAVARGARVEAGELLFELEHEQEAAALTVAEQEVQRAVSRLADLRKGERPSERQRFAARVERERAALNLARREFERRSRLFAQQAIAAEELDRARGTLKQQEALLAAARADLATADLGARSDAIRAGEAEVEAARARLTQARWAVDNKTRQAPVAALVFDTFYEPGEQVPANYPVVSLLPPRNLKLRFFVPLPEVEKLAIGRQVSVSFGGQGETFSAAIDSISPQVEYTPPVIYSRETRAELVFEVEARSTAEIAARLHPGQPVDVWLAAP